MSIEEQLNEMSCVPLLTAEEEILLGSQVQKMMAIIRANCSIGQVSDSNISKLLKELDTESKKTVKKGLKARDKMIAANMRLVVFIAKKLKTGEVHMTIQDMIQEGAIGLAKAVEKFEPERGYKFSTYAYWWIKQGINRASDNLEKTIRIPLNVQKNIKDIRNSKNVLTASLGREPTIAEIAEKLGKSVEKIEKSLLLSVSVLSLDTFYAEEDDRLIDKIIVDSDGFLPADDCSGDRGDLAMKFLEALPLSEQNLIKQAYGIDCERKSIKEIAKSQEITDQALRERLRVITNKIRKAVLMITMAKI
jgi:RNA polymerase nonessential primary-like sigma factor